MGKAFIVGGGRGYKGKLHFGGFPPVFECGSVWGRVVGLNSKATSFADSIDKMVGVSSPKSHTSLDSCIHDERFLKERLCMHGSYLISLISNENFLPVSVVNSIFAISADLSYQLDRVGEISMSFCSFGCKVKFSKRD